MISFPNAKINLGLNILEKRPDGYHNIESVFYPIGWCDILEIIPAPFFSFSSSGLEIPGDPARNLIVSAFKLLQTQGILQEEVSIHLHKVIPMGAGIGGGSADAAFALNMMNDLFTLNLSTSALQELAGRLGSDCPFFIRNKPVFCYDKGGAFEDITLSLKGKYLVAVNPGIHISTVEAYSGVTPQKPETDIRTLISAPITHWKHQLKNDFENNLLIKYPAISVLKEQLYQLGAAYASMTGSGSTVYGIFEEKPAAMSFQDNYNVWEGYLE